MYICEKHHDFEKERKEETKASKLLTDLEYEKIEDCIISQF